MTYEEAYEAALQCLRERNPSAAYEVIDGYRRATPAGDDYGAAHTLLASISMRLGRDPRNDQRLIRYLLREAASYVSPGTKRWGELCMVAIRAAAVSCGVTEARRWAKCFATGDRQSPAWRECLPNVLACYSGVLRAYCRFAAAEAVLNAAYEAASCLAVTPKRDDEMRQYALMAAWCAVQQGKQDRAEHWLALSDGRAVTACWGDVHLAVVASLHIARHSMTAAKALLLRTAPHKDDVGGMYVAMAKVRLAIATGMDWRAAVGDAQRQAAATKQLWACRILQNMADQAQGEVRRRALG